MCDSCNNTYVFSVGHLMCSYGCVHWQEPPLNKSKELCNHRPSVIPIFSRHNPVSNQLIGVLLTHSVGAYGWTQMFTYTDRSCSHDHGARTFPFTSRSLSHNKHLINQSSVLSVFNLVTFPPLTRCPRFAMLDSFASGVIMMLHSLKLHMFLDSPLHW